MTTVKTTENVVLDIVGDHRQVVYVVYDLGTYFGGAARFVGIVIVGNGTGSFIFGKAAPTLVGPVVGHVHLPIFRHS